MSNTMLVEEKILLNGLIGAIETTGFVLGAVIIFPPQFLPGKLPFGNGLLKVFQGPFSRGMIAKAPIQDQHLR